ncbi:MAG: aminoacyl-tRNA deacylase [Armatimonadota bacterium]|nr:aminoacyl-tRNA deacylase [Armatimonadota bacterium]
MRTRATAVLESLGIPYELLEFEAEEYTAAEAVERLGLRAAQLFKTLVVRTDQGQVMLACVPADRELNLRALARVAGAKRVELVDASELMRLVGYVKGAVSPLGTRRRCATFIDRSALDHARVSVSAGLRGLQIWLDPRDLARATTARVEPLT